MDTTYAVDKSWMRTKPKSTGIGPETNPCLLVGGRYGTADMIPKFGPNATFQYILNSQAMAIKVLSENYPIIVPPEHAKILVDTANLDHISPQRIREIEADTHHDVVSINNAWEEVVNEIYPAASSHINKGRTSADSTETAKALQLKESTEIIINSLENLKDIILEKAMSWKDIPYMDLSHRYDALPTTAGRPLVHYAEMLQSDIDKLYQTYQTSLFGKWGDATGNHHALTSIDVDNPEEIEKMYCEALGLLCMDAPAQTPGREYLFDFIEALGRASGTMANIATYIATGRGDDTNTFINVAPGKKVGSSTMPHKTVKNGNPSKEEQTMSYDNMLGGFIDTAHRSIRMAYARDLSNSASDRIMHEIAFKWGDEVIRNLAKTVYYTNLNVDRSIERVERSFGVVTSSPLMTQLTDHRKIEEPLSRKEAHDLTAELAKIAWDQKRPFIDVLGENKEIIERLDNEKLRKITNPLTYMGQSKEIIQTVYDKYHGQHKFADTQQTI
ncbi:hypothetical protein GQ473_05760 [archaeon]|nr:hypothetical protein [archaeon]